MKVLGIVGGIGPDSTIEYYRSIFREYRSAVPDGSSPQMVIRSVDVRVLLDLIGKGQYAEMASYLSEAIGSLAGAGADFAIIAANTPHIIFDDLHKMSRIPLLSIVEATCKAAEFLHMSNLGLTEPALRCRRISISVSLRKKVFRWSYRTRTNKVVSTRFMLENC